MGSKEAMGSGLAITHRSLFQAGDRASRTCVIARPDPSACFQDLTLQPCAACFSLFSSALLFKEFGVRPRPNEHDHAAVALIDQQEVPANMAFPVVRPLAPERVIPPLGRQGPIVGNDQEHDLLKAVQVISARARQPLPVFGESLGVVSAAQQRGPLTACRLFRGH